MNGFKSVVEYNNFREFLKDRYHQEKARNKKFSFRYFARIAGFKSPSFLKLVMDGKANLSRKSAIQVAEALKLGKEDATFFKDLVLFNQSLASEEKNIYAQRLIASQKYRKIHPISEAQYNYYAQWYFIPVRELVALPFFRNDPEWIASQINPPIEPKEAKKAIEELLALGLIIKNPEGKITQANSNINTADEVTSYSIAQYHREMMKKAIESIDRIPRQDREISSITIGVSSKMAKKVKERIQSFRREIAGLLSQDSEVDTVYQLNFQFFPVTKIPEKKEKASRSE